MLENEEKQMIQMLLQATGFLTSEELSFQISMSSKTIRRRLKELEPLLEKHGAAIVSKKGIGFQLHIMDEEKFLEFKQNNLLNSESSTQKNGQIGSLINILMAQEDYTKADDLAEVLFVSKSKLTQMLHEVRMMLQNYDLEIVSKPYYGLKIEGSEFNIRRFISSYYAQNTYNVEMSRPYVNHDRYQEIRIIVEGQLQQFHYSMPFNIVQSLMMHLYIIITRLSKGMCIPNDMMYTNHEEYECEWILTKAIIHEIEQHFQIEFPLSEYEYLLLHIVGKRVMDISESHNIPTEINRLIDRILQRIKETSNLDFLSDLDLRIMLGLHMVPLLTRLRYHIEMKNPILEEVRSRCVAGYDLAIICAKVIQEKTGFVLSEHEISYFALHFDVSLNRSSEQIRKKHILVICSSGRASAQLLKVKFMNLFSNYLETIDVCDANDAQMYLKTRTYDFIFTTIPCTLDTHIPIFEFQFFLNDYSVKMIQSVLHGSVNDAQILRYFQPSLFFGKQSFSTKEEALTSMLKKIRSVQSLPNNFEELVWERESVYGTDILPQVALPHPNQVITEDTFISVMILKKPILWNRVKVRMIFLISIARIDSEKYKFLFELIINLLSDTMAVKRIIDNGTYESLRHELLQLKKEEK